MALEDKIDVLVAALNANTEAHGGKVAGKTVAGKPGGKPPVADKITPEMVKTAVFAVRDTFSKTVAIALIKKVAKAADIASIKPSFYAAVIEACDEKMAEAIDTTDEAAPEDDEL